MEEQETKNDNKKVIPYKYREPDSDITNVEKAFGDMFEKAKFITTCNVRPGKTSSVIYVPKEYSDKIATVIIWDKPVEYYENDGEY